MLLRLGLLEEDRELVFHLLHLLVSQNFELLVLVLLGLRFFHHFVLKLLA